MRSMSGIAKCLVATSLATIAAGCAATDAGPPGGVGLAWSKINPFADRVSLKDPSHFNLSYAQWQEQLGNIPEAEKSYRRVLASEPESIDALIGLARLEQLAGHAQEAERAYLQAAKAVPNDARVLDAIGQFYSAEKRWDEAAAALAAAVAAAPDDDVIRHHYAIALARSGDSARALSQFTRAVGEAEAHYNIGFIHYEQGHRQLAEREFLQAVTLRPDLEAAQAMLDELHGRKSGTVLASGEGADAPGSPGQAVARSQRPEQSAPKEIERPDDKRPSSIPPQWHPAHTPDAAEDILAEQARNQGR